MKMTGHFTRSVLIAVSAPLMLAAQCSEPALSFSGPDGEFGIQPVGSVTQRTFTVTNSGDADAILGDISVAPPASGPSMFSVSGGSCASGRTLAAHGGTCTVSVRFAPSVAEPSVTLLHVHYSWEAGTSLRRIDRELPGEGADRVVFFAD